MLPRHSARSGVLLGTILVLLNVLVVCRADGVDLGEARRLSEETLRRPAGALAAQTLRQNLIKSHRCSSRSFSFKSCPDIKVLSMNVWDNLSHSPTGAWDTAQLIKELKPDIVCFQEIDSDVLKHVNSHVGSEYTSSIQPNLQPGSLGVGILSRLGVAKTYEPKSRGSFQVPRLQAIKVEGMIPFRVVNAHLYPDPRATLMLSEGDLAEEVISKVEQTQKVNGIYSVMNLIVDSTAHERTLPTLFVGDLNMPSTLDHTAKSTKEYAHMRHADVVALSWPVSRELQKAQFVDTFRHVHPDANTQPGFTYPADGSGDKISDRIDYIYVRDGSHLAAAHWTVKSSELVKTVPNGKKWPSDHFAVMTVLTLSLGSEAVVADDSLTE